MKRRNRSNSRWLIVTILCVVYAFVAVAIREHAASSESAEANAPKEPQKTERLDVPAEASAIAAAPVDQRVAEAPASLIEAAEEDAPPPAEPVADAPLPQVEQENASGDEPEESIEEWLVRSNEIYSLHEAARSGDVKVLLERVQEGAAINAKDEMGNTPLHLAAMGGHVEIAHALLKLGADSMAKNKEGKRPSELAASDAILSACQAAESVRRREIALFDAVRAGKEAEVRAALQAGVNANALSEDNEHSLLTVAAQEGQVKVARALLQAGADVRYVEPSSRGVLNIAAGTGNLEMVQLLLRAGADPMMHTNHGAYPIHDAIWARRTAVAVALIPYYKSVKYNPDGKGNGYPICMAISFGNTEVVKAFLEAGLDPNDPAFADKPLLERAEEKGNKDIIRLLRNANAKKEPKKSKSAKGNSGKKRK